MRKAAPVVTDWTARDAQLVLEAITAYTHDDDDSALAALNDIHNTAEALVLAVGLAAWLARQHPDGDAVLQHLGPHLA
jgi:hypothetical protein